MSFDFNEIDKAEWRELGFYYDIDESNQKNQWRFYGSKKGLRNIVSILEEYVKDPKNLGISGHIHLGPYQYLEIITWKSPQITREGIMGSFEDFKKLEAIFENKLSVATLGDDFTIDTEYSDCNIASIRCFVMNDNFDPVSLDKY